MHRRPAARGTGARRAGLEVATAADDMLVVSGCKKDNIVGAHTRNWTYQDAPAEGEYRFFQLAFVVDDLIEASRKWTDVLGVGPFHVMPRRQSKAIYRGQPVEIDTRTAFAQTGPAFIELIQSFGDGPDIYRELYGPGEGGWHHMATVTKAYDETLAHYRDRGYAVALEFPEKRVAYLDTYKDFGFFAEVIERTDLLISQAARIADNCAAWQGEDPVRILTREGYRLPEPA